MLVSLVSSGGLGGVRRPPCPFPCLNPRPEACCTRSATRCKGLCAEALGHAVSQLANTRAQPSTLTNTCIHGISLLGLGRPSGRHGRSLGRRRSFAARTPRL